MTRRKFIEKSGSFSLSAIGIVGLAALLEGCSEDDSSNPVAAPTSQFTINLADHTELQKVGGFKTFQMESTPIIVFRTGDTTFKALSLVCTHQACTVNWQQSSKKFTCPCHSSTFNENGDVTNGPASTNLATFTTEYKAETNQLIINP